MEGCECWFSESNHLAASIHHASVFHRQQSMHEYTLFSDTFHTYAHISKFLVNNYKQALAIIMGEPQLKAEMAWKLIGSYDDFERWRREELNYLKKQVKADIPVDDQLKMEYVSKLKSFFAAWYVISFFLVLSTLLTSS